jgi:hypothetical protein
MAKKYQKIENLHKYIIVMKMSIFKFEKKLNFDYFLKLTIHKTRLVSSTKIDPTWGHLSCIHRVVWVHHKRHRHLTWESSKKFF